MSTPPGAGRSDEQRLIEAAAAGDLQAFEELARGVHEQAYRIARRILGSPEEAADLAQRACLRVWERLHRFHPRRGSFRSWYCRIVVNLAIDRHRRLKLQRRFEIAAEPRLGREPLSPAAAPDEALRAVEIERVFERVAVFLSGPQRAAFTLVEVEGLDSTQAAEIMGVRASTVRNHLAAARAVLRAQMHRLFPEYCRSRDAG
jgi:RNA polymerase sigma-70 factor (ECF subfamily)